MKHLDMVAVQFENPLVSVSYCDLVWNLSLINLAKQKIHIKYSFDKTTNSKDLCFLVSHKKIF